MHQPLRYQYSSVQKAQSLRKEMTDAERKLWSRLRGTQIGYYFRRQTPIGNYIVDFVCWKAQLIIEVDGGQHYTGEGIEYDKRRDEYLRAKGFRVL